MVRTVSGHNCTPSISRRCSLVEANEVSAARRQQCFCTVWVVRSPATPNTASAAYDPPLPQVQLQ